ncbi:MAG: DNA recombination protein RmuC [Muribaculaceae bacterium]|nr:DNA recombination protein RmuC [Muribaculaceae bacterium]
MEILLAIISLAAIVMAAYFARRAFNAENSIQALTAEKAALEAKAELLSTPRVLTAQTRSDLAEALRPMRESMDAVKNRLEAEALANAKERHSLGEQVRELAGISRNLGGETRLLSDALRGNSRIQGQWGEHVLENILERAGLRRGEDFEVQSCVRTAEGETLRPDVLIRYRDGRRIAVDAKTSIGAYLELCEAEGDEARRRAASAHVESVRKHVGELRTKAYQDYLGRESADFVLMFIPNEGAYMKAMELDKGLWEKAYESRVIIVSPTHLLTVLKLIGQIWRTEKQTQNVAEIARAAGLMLDKFSDFLADMESINIALNRTRKAYDSALVKLNGQRGSLLSQAAKIKDLGAKSKLTTEDAISDSQ